MRKLTVLGFRGLYSLYVWPVVSTPRGNPPTPSPHSNSPPPHTNSPRTSASHRLQPLINQFNKDKEEALLVWAGVGIRSLGKESYAQDLTGWELDRTGG